jgi:glycosyltransferase involved in cell wall biosynthesis
LPLKVVGDGPLTARVQAAAQVDASIECLGPQPLSEVYRLVGEAAFLILPSLWYEHFPRVIVEAFAKGTPVVASRLGAMAELVEDGRTGLHFEPGNAADLAVKVRWLLADPSALAQMRRAARQEFSQKYTATANHEQLMTIYEKALEGSRKKFGARIGHLATGRSG